MPDELNGPLVVLVDGHELRGEEASAFIARSLDGGTLKVGGVERLRGLVAALEERRDDPVLQRAFALVAEYREARLRAELDMGARWMPTLAPELVVEIERKMEAGEDLTKAELEQYHVAVKVTQPQTNDEAEWDRWYETPVAAMLPRSVASEQRTATPSRPRQAHPRGRRTSRGRRARAPSARSGDDDPHELAAALAAVIDAHGPRSASWLATQVGRRKKVVLQALHLGRFVQVGKGRSSTWANVPVAPVAFRDAVWRARSRGALDGIEAIELLLEPPPGVLAMLERRPKVPA
jgi:hypothetical protein